MENKITFQTDQKEISSSELAEEMVPILRDYFCGEINYTNKNIIMKMPNGQTFRLFVLKC